MHPQRMETTHTLQCLWYRNAKWSGCYLRVSKPSMTEWDFLNPSRVEWCSYKPTWNYHKWKLYSLLYCIVLQCIALDCVLHCCTLYGILLCKVFFIPLYCIGLCSTLLYIVWYSYLQCIVRYFSFHCIVLDSITLYWNIVLHHDLNSV